jgi:hypothetical protein
MKAYLLTTGLLFGAVVVAHVWRVIEEGAVLLKNPWWVFLTALAGVLCVWACRLLWLLNRGGRP